MIFNAIGERRNRSSMSTQSSGSFSATLRQCRQTCESVTDARGSALEDTSCQIMIRDNVTLGFQFNLRTMENIFVRSSTGKWLIGINAFLAAFTAMEHDFRISVSSLSCKKRIILEGLS